MATLRERKFFFWSMALLAGLLIVSFGLSKWLQPAGGWEVNLKSTDLAKGFGILVLIALFVERATEVAVGVFRDPKRTKAQSALSAAQELLGDARQREEEFLKMFRKGELSATIDPKEMLNELKKEIARLIDDVEEKYHNFRVADDEAEFKASVPSVIIAFFIALSGITTLDLFFEFKCEMTFLFKFSSNLLNINIDIPCDPAGVFERFRNAVDVALTALLIGGGAKGIRAIWKSIGNTIGRGQGSFRGT